MATGKAETHLKVKKDKKKDKDKSRESTTTESEFKAVKASLVVSIPPVFAASPRTGVGEILDSMVMRYIPALGGVVLSHSNLSFLNETATIKADCPFPVSDVGFDAIVWSPHVRMKLLGKVNLCSPDHISLLVHRTFNVSIPRHHIPMTEWEFEYGPAENDPEFGPSVQDENTKDHQAPEKQGEGGGKWVHKITGDKLGGLDGFLEFTVIGLIVANEMLSLLGSVQADPFSPEHVPEHASSTKILGSNHKDDNGQAGARELNSKETGHDDDESDQDMFQHLGRDGSEAIAAEAVEEVQLVAKEKRQKRKMDKNERKGKEGNEGHNQLGGEKKSKRRKI